MIQAILFDFNGVIINDEPLQLQAYQQVLGRQGVELTAEQYYALMGMDDRAFVTASFKRAGKEMSDDLLHETIEGKSEIHRGLIEQDLPFFPGVLTFLKATGRRYQLGLVSMARKVEIDYVLERARLQSLFSAVVSAEAVSNHKPHPECYKLGLEKLNENRQAQRRLPLLPNECLVIEDAAQGIEAARSVGMHTIGMTNTIVEAVLREAGAEVVTANLADWTIESIELLFD